MSEQKQIYTLITKVMADIGAIGKDRKNEKQGYKFRGIDDVYNAANSALSKHGVFSVPTVLEALREERTNANGTVLFYVSLKVKYTFYAPDGSFVEAVIPCEGFDSGDKATNKALSAGQKYAFLQVFCIPTEEQKDSEADDHEVKPAPKPEQPKETAKRSDWYYTLRDAITTSETMESLASAGENIGKHKGEVSDKELEDLRNAYAKQTKKLNPKG